MTDHYCKNLLPNGMCKKTGKLCDEALPTNVQEPYQTYLKDSLFEIPPACRGCSNHSSNGGSGICFCTLGSMEFTAGTTSGNDIQYSTNIATNDAGV